MSEKEVAHVAGAELHFEAVGRVGEWERHDAGVVDEHVEAGFLCEELLRGGLDRGEGG